MKQIKLSVVLATHNEENNLFRCLKSIEKLADEIIIVDGESTDKTVKIAKQFSAKIIITSNKANFHINKQMAMNEARGELVLQLDADEVVDKKLANFIFSLKEKIAAGKSLANFQPKAWNLKRKNWFLGKFLKKGGQYPDPVIRLYLNGFAKLPKKDIHEQMAVDGEVEFAPGHLLHYSNLTFDDYLRKFSAYTTFKAQQLKNKKVRINFANSIKYLVIKPTGIFLSLFIRHKGFIDGWAGFVFALFSGIYWQLSYLKLWELYETKN